MSHSGQLALITGASGGIGYELARVFSSEGYDLVLTARSESRLSGVADELQRLNGTTSTIIPADLSGPGAADELWARVMKASGAPAVLVNNAGFALFGSFATTDIQTELNMMQLNMVALTHLTKCFLSEALARRSGKILNVASTAAFQPGPLMAVYYATKAYVLSFSEALSEELSGTGVTVTALCPGPTASGFQRRAAMEDSRLVKDKKIADAAEVARTGYDGLMRGSTVVIPGFRNRAFVQAIRFTPRRVATRAVKLLQDRA